MDFNIEVRRKQLENLEQYISSSRDKVQSIFDCLRWTPERTQEEEAFVRCSIDPAHTVPTKFIERHHNKCLLHKNGYCTNDVFLSEPLHDPRSSIVIDNHKKIEVQSNLCWNGQDADPKTSERLLTTFSPDERLALYNYVANSTTGPTEVPEFNITQPKRSVDKQLTYEEILAQERDAKRRRTKYKSVHTNHKTHIEIMREVIEGQMELYSDWLLESNVVPNCSLDNLPSNEIDGNSDQSSHQNEKTAEISEVESKADEREQSVISRTSDPSGSTKSTNKKSDYQDYDKHDRKPSRKRYNDHKRNDYRDRSYHSSRDHRDRSSSRKYSHDRERTYLRYDELQFHHNHQLNANSVGNGVSSVLENYGWFLLVLVVVIAYLYNKFYSHKEDFFKKRAEQEYAAKYHKDPELFAQRISAQQFYVQDKYHKEAEEYKKKMDEKDIKKREAWLEKQDANKPPGNKLGTNSEISHSNDKSKSLRTEYNPLMGGASGSTYRAQHKKPCSGGGCGK